MVLFYIRHGEPIYNPDSLTELGKIQAEAVCKRLTKFGVDKIYSSTSNRAVQTAMPLCDLLNKEPELLDFCHENHAWRELTIERNGEKNWLFKDEEMKNLLSDPAVLSLGFNWYEHPSLQNYRKGMERICDESDKFLKSLGYEHIRETGKYKVIESNDRRVALFAHHGFGLAFLSAILDIPYPVFSTHFDICHTGMTVINFEEENGFSVPKILTLSSDAHLYKDDISVDYVDGVVF